MGDNNNDGFSASPVNDITRNVFSVATINLNDCVHAAPFEPGVIMTGTVSLKAENSKNCFSPAGLMQTVAVEPAPLPISVSGPRLPQPPFQPEAQLLSLLVSH